jgi:tetratricopeptide (TPR) repeat protein
MSENLFIPKMKNAEEPRPAVAPPQVEETHSPANWFMRIAQYSVIALFGFITIFFTPKLWASLVFDKAMVAIVVITVVTVILSLLMLRQSQVRTVLPVSLGIFWLFIIAAIVSGSLSGDIQDAFRGSFLETQTVVFLALIAFMMTIPLVLQGNKKLTIEALALFAVTSILLVVYNLLRLFLGPEFLSFGTFSDLTASPVGGFNDLAIFATLLVIIGLISLTQLPLTKPLQGAVAALTFFSLAILAVVNFFNIWIIVGAFSLLLFVYLLSRDTLFGSANMNVKTPRYSTVVLTVAAIVCVVSATFLLAGNQIGGKLSQLVDVSYVEVRPSLTATIGVTKSVYEEDLLFGVGPNRFADAWRLHKDRNLNETIFWETEFNAGNSFVSTIFVNIGLVGGILLILFHLWFLYLGYRILLRSTNSDLYWYYFGSLSFTAAVFLWAMTYIYVPGPTILLLAGLFTGFTYVAAGALLPHMVKRVPLAVSERRGFFLMSAAIAMVILSILSAYTISKQYVAQQQFARAQVLSASVEEFEKAAASAYGLYADDRFLSTRVQVILADLNNLLSVQDPSEEQQQQFLSAAEQALLLSEQAIRNDMTNPTHHVLLAGVYANLAFAGVDGALERAELAMEEAKRLDPQNPGYHMLVAQMSARLGDTDRAREHLTTALNLKRNYTAALYLLTQIDISDGDVEAALATTRSIITLEPRNPTRYYQLGLLLSANEQTEEAVSAFQVAIILDPQYANARYLLALAYLGLEQPELALEQLRVVQRTNTDDQQLATFIAEVESGEYQIPVESTLDTPVREIDPTDDQADVPLGQRDVESNLVSPVNVITNTRGSATEFGQGSEATTVESENREGEAVLDGMESAE